MKIRLLITLCCVSCLSDYVFADGEDEVKKGHYPFMAFIYYPDESIIDETGKRFLRGAVLVKPESLITSFIRPGPVNDAPIGFPRKTLLARLGSTYIDANFTLNEDEDEQEREVIQIIHPYNYNESQWWLHDIAVLKTLLPFNLTSVVGTATIHTKSGVISNTNCYILVFNFIKKFGNWTGERYLSQMFVELQYPFDGTCGPHFDNKTMLCASDGDENRSTAYDSNFCQGNSGGPLICENRVTGLQTYIDNDCKSPHLYQLLSAWNNFLVCSIEDKCGEELCSNMCIIIDKDKITQGTTLDEDPTVQTIPVEEIIAPVTEGITIPTFGTSELSTEDVDIPTVTFTSSSAVEQSVEVNTTSTTVVTLTTVPSTTPAMSPTTTTEATTLTLEVSRSEEVAPTTWPKDNPERSRIIEDEEKIGERKANMEAHHHDIMLVTTKPRSAAERSLSVPLSVLIQFVLASLMV